MNKSDIKNLEDALEAFEGIKPNEKVTLTVDRKGNKLNVDINTELQSEANLKAIAETCINRNSTYKIKSINNEVYLYSDKSAIESRNSSRTDY